MKDIKILLFDIETAPLLGYTWGVWEENVIETKEDWYMLSFAWKWYGEKEVTVHGLPDFKGYRKDKQNDEPLVAKLHKLLEEADIVVGHNIDRFDIRKSNARFIAHCLPPPKPYRSIDTLKIARRHFKFDSNKLDDLGHYLGVGRKLAHTGKHLWLGCMNGDMKAWKLMKEYNKQDVVLLERVYERLRPWGKPIASITEHTREPGCTKCGSKNLSSRGYGRTMTQEYQRFQCRDCGGWCNGNYEKLKTKVKRSA